MDAVHVNNLTTKMGERQGREAGKTGAENEIVDRAIPGTCIGSKQTEPIQKGRSL